MGDRFPYIIGQRAEIFYNGEWRQGKIINGYRFEDGIVTIRTDDGVNLWCPEEKKYLYRMIGNKKIEKKILPKYFKDVENGNKRFEIRKDEDNVQIWDKLILREWDGKEYTGMEKSVIVSYVLRNAKQFGLQDGYCIIGW